MVFLQRKIFILLDNAPSHKVHRVQMTKIGEFDAIVLSNITFLFIPTNLTFVVQSLDQDMIIALKFHYKCKLLAWTLDQYAAK